LNNNVKDGHLFKQSYANTRTTGKEQYYTRPDVVDECMRAVVKAIPDYRERTILEPAGGTGEFIKGFDRAGISSDNVISYDIDPRHPDVEKGNYLEKKFKAKDLVSITNPPFGRNSELARKFFRHGADHCEFICYLVPRSWKKWTVRNSLPSNFHLISETTMPKESFYLDSDSEEINDSGVLQTVFQIWQRKEDPRPTIKIPDHGLIKKIQPKMKKVMSHRKIKQKLFEKEAIGYKEFEIDCYEKVKVNRPDYVTGANFEIIVFGHSCGTCRTINIDKEDAKTTTMYLKVDRQDVKDALRKIDYSKYYNNVSYVQALSIQEINYELNEYFGLENFKFEEGMQ
tara:strand:- start:2020 stop:3045 length:1026 start_codon:yes stop_codon:yes gene_type:complete